MNYPYANGIIKAIEGNLFDKAKYTKLAKAEKADFVATLSSLGYGNGTQQDQLADVINTELITLKQLLESISPQRQYTDLFYLTYDAMNLKVLYKEKIFAVPRPDILVTTGAIDVGLLTDVVTTGDLTQLPKAYQPLLAGLANAVVGIDNPRTLSATIDDHVFAFVFRAIRGSLGGALKAYFRAFVDFANVITLVRSHVLGWEPLVFMGMLIHGGQIPLSVYEAAYQELGDAFPRSFMDYYEEKITKVLKKYQETQNLDKLERSLDNLTLEIVSKFRFDAFGIGPIIYYFLKKQAEAKTIRSIYADSFTDLSDLVEY